MYIVVPQKKKKNVYSQVVKYEYFGLSENNEEERI